MIKVVERKIRERAQQIYEDRGHVEGCALADWVQAESEVLQKSILAPLYRRSKMGDQDPAEFASATDHSEPAAQDAAAW